MYNNVYTCVYMYVYIYICIYIGVYMFIYNLLENLAPYGGQTSSSCRGLVAFVHQLGALQAPK